MGTDELVLNHSEDSVEINLGDGEILSLTFPRMSINGQEMKCPPDAFKLMEGEIICRSFTDLSYERVAVVSWTVYSDDWDNENWTVSSWVIAQKGSYDERRYVEESIVLMESSAKMLEENIKHANIN